MQIEPIDRLKSTLLNIFMGAMHRIARLKTDHAPPTTLGKERAGLRRRVAGLRKRLILQIQDTHRATEKHVTLLIDHLDAGMVLVLGTIDLASLELLIIRKLLFDRHHRL